jgi:hypothetical protein
MKITRWTLALTLLALALPARAQETPKNLVATYNALADGILALHRAEADLVRTLLETHRQAAADHAGRGEWDKAAAEVALFASEGDNAIGGIRKKLVEGNHHHNAAGEQVGAFEPGYVLVTREAKQQGLAIASALRQARSEEERKKAWADFEALARKVLRAG